MSTKPQETQNEKHPPSREEIESACILYVIGRAGCPADKLATLLGLSPQLTTAVANSVAPLVNAGWVVQNNQQLSLTDAGQLWLKEHLTMWVPAHVD